MRELYHLLKVGDVTGFIALSKRIAVAWNTIPDGEQETLLQLAARQGQIFAILL